MRDLRAIGWLLSNKFWSIVARVLFIVFLQEYCVTDLLTVSASRSPRAISRKYVVNRLTPFQIVICCCSTPLQQLLAKNYLLLLFKSVDAYSMKTSSSFSRFHDRRGRKFSNFQISIIFPLFINNRLIQAFSISRRDTVPSKPRRHRISFFAILG